MMQPLKHQSDLIATVREKGQSRVLLHWGLGSGKTLAATMLSREWADPIKVIVCPKSLVSMWVKFLGSEGETVQDLTANAQLIPGYNVINYDLLIYRPQLVKALQREIYTLILDESSYIKTHTAKRSKICVKLGDKAAHVCMLSGTPCGGHYEYMWTQGHLLGWEINYKAYQAAFCNRVEIEVNGRRVQILDRRDPYRNLDILRQRLRAHGMYQLRTEDCVSLPEATDMTIEVESTPEYRRFARDRIISLPDGTDLVGDHILSQRQGMRRLASSYNPNKLQAVEDLLESTAERVVIFYQFARDYENLKALCGKLDRPVSAINGQVKDLTAYEQQADSVTLVQWQSGGMGLNLQKARIEVFYSLTDSVEQYQQARGRIRRMGQTHPCIYYNIAARGTVDGKIMRALERGIDYDAELFVADYPDYAGDGDEGEVTDYGTGEDL